MKRKSLADCNNNLLSPSKISSQSAPPSSPSSLKPRGSLRLRGGRGGERVHGMARSSSMWSVYLIVATRLPRTYVGVTTNFFRRLKQHNGELKGGAKASSAGRPWSLACIIQGFKDRSEGGGKDATKIKLEDDQGNHAKEFDRRKVIKVHKNWLASLNQNGRVSHGKHLGKRIRTILPQIYFCSTGKQL